MLAGTALAHCRVSFPPAADAASRSQHAHVLSLFAGVLGPTLTSNIKVFPAQKAALQQDAPLCRSLVQLLLPAAAAAAVSLQVLPAGDGGWVVAVCYPRCTVASTS